MLDRERVKYYLKPHSVTEFLIFLYILGAVVYFSTIPISLIFKDPNDVNFLKYVIIYFVLVYTCVVWSMIILLPFGILYLVIEFLHMKYKTGILEQYRNHILIGYGGIAVFSFIPRVTVHFTNNALTNYFCPVITVLSFSLIYAIVLYKPTRATKYNNKCSKWHCFVLFVLHIIVLIATWHSGSYYTDNDQRETIELTHFCFSFIFCASTMEFYSVLSAGLRLKDDNESQKTKKIDTSLECKICLLEYSETRLPRMFKKCGHTICEGYADQLLNRQYLLCPFCQKCNWVDGPAKTLPTNFALMDVIEMKNSGL